MKFKEQHKTALAKVLSDLVQCDGIVNQGEIDFLQQVYALFNITKSWKPGKNSDFEDVSKSLPLR